MVNTSLCRRSEALADDTGVLKKVQNKTSNTKESVLCFIKDQHIPLNSPYAVLSKVQYYD